MLYQSQPNPRCHEHPQQVTLPDRQSHQDNRFPLQYVTYILNSQTRLFTNPLSLLFNTFGNHVRLLLFRGRTSYLQLFNIFCLVTTTGFRFIISTQNMSCFNMPLAYNCQTKLLKTRSCQLENPLFKLCFQPLTSKCFVLLCTLREAHYSST